MRVVPTAKGREMRFVMACLVLVLGACSGDSVTGLQDAIPYTDPQLRVLWSEMESCSGLRGDFDSIHFYIAPDGITRNGEGAGALWVREGNAIYLTPPVKNDPMTIKHEEMHALLQGGADHPAKYFSGACGELMLGR